jgi:hypothetical protein
MIRLLNGLFSESGSLWSNLYIKQKQQAYTSSEQIFRGKSRRQRGRILKFCFGIHGVFRSKREIICLQFGNLDRLLEKGMVAPLIKRLRVLETASRNGDGGTHT